MAGAMSSAVATDNRAHSWIGLNSPPLAKLVEKQPFAIGIHVIEFIADVNIPISIENDILTRRQQRFLPVSARQRPSTIDIDYRDGRLEIVASHRA